MFNNLVAPPPFVPRPSSAQAPLLGAEEQEEEARALLEEHLDETAVLPADLGQSGYDVVPDEHAPAPARR